MINLSRFILIFLLLAPALAPVVANAKDYSIAAVVNEDVITNYSLQQRTDLVIRSSNLQESAEVRKEILPKVLQIMIDDKLKMQEAKRLKIDVTEEDMKRAMTDLEEQNNLAPGGFDQFLQKNNFPKDALEEQLRSQIAWRKIIGQKIRPRISLSDNELNENYDIAVSKFAKSKTNPKPEKTKVDIDNSKVKLKQIIVAAAKENPTERSAGNAKMKELIKKIKSCNDISTLSQQNQSADIQYNDLGSLKLSQIDPKLKPLLATLAPGQPGPILTSDMGFAVFVVCSRDEALIKIKEPEQTAPEKSKIAEILGSQKIDLEARRYLKNLRDDAYIETRI